MNEEQEQVGLPTVIPGTTIAHSTTVEDIEKGLKLAEKMVDAQDRLMKILIRSTNNKDWIDQADKPYLQASGCNKIARNMGIRVSTIVREEHNREDDRGAYIEIVTSAAGEWNGKVTQQVGSASTRDRFFAERWMDGEKILLPLSEIDLGNVRKKSHTNLLNRLIKDLLGLSFTWEEIEEASSGKITKTGGTVFTYDKGKAGGKNEAADSGTKRSEIRTMIMDMCDGEEGAAKAMLQEFTSFKNKEGKVIPGKTSVDKLSDKQLPYTHRDVLKKYDEYTKALGRTPEPAKAPTPAAPPPANPEGYGEGEPAI